MTDVEKDKNLAPESSEQQAESDRLKKIAAEMGNNDVNAKEKEFAKRELEIKNETERREREYKQCVQIAFSAREIQPDGNYKYLDDGTVKYQEYLAVAKEIDKANEGVSISSGKKKPLTSKQDLALRLDRTNNDIKTQQGEKMTNFEERRDQYYRSSVAPKI